MVNQLTGIMRAPLMARSDGLCVLILENESDNKSYIWNDNYDS